MTTKPQHDVIIIGGGPTGATAGIRAARRGLRVLLLEQAVHPRFHVGESFLPRNLQLIRDLGLDDGLAGLPQIRKVGASFALGHEDDTSDFYFENGLLGSSPETFNIERAPFDHYLLETARQNGVEVLENCKVLAVMELEDGRVTVKAQKAEAEPALFQGRFLLDASGQAALVGRHLGTRRALADLKRVAYYGHFEGVRRRGGIESGFPHVIMCKEGWFWFIPINDTHTSIGLVLDTHIAEQVKVSPREMLAWGLARCPLAREWTRNAVFPPFNHVTADFSYTCRPYAGPGYFLVGDAATFVDPIFSTGVCLGMMGGVMAADSVHSILREQAEAARMRRDYIAYVERSCRVFFRLVRAYYRHSFRELFLHGVGPLQIHKAVISVLSGHVFPPEPSLSLRWRLRLFELFVRLQRFVPLAPRRGEYSLLRGAVQQGPELPRESGTVPSTRTLE